MTRRVRTRHVEWVAERTSRRDLAIVETANRLRLVTGSQLEHLHFTDLAARSRPVVRRRVLARLVDWRVLTTLERRIGGVRAGSSGLVYALDTAGQRLLQLRSEHAPDRLRLRRPGVPGERFVRHALAVTELYVRLAEGSRVEGFTLSAFRAEPACWWPDGLGGRLKPDAYAVLSLATHDDAWWVEVDRATESLPTIKGKLLTYLDFVTRGQLGPGGLVPRVLVTVPDAARERAVRAITRRLPEPAERLLHVATAEAAPGYLLRRLQE